MWIGRPSLKLLRTVTCLRTGVKRSFEVGGIEDPPSFYAGSLKMLRAKSMNLLLLIVPLPFFVEPLGLAPGITFALCCLCILPLAGLLGDATEQVALHTSETLGGLLNATFGNATELIVCIFALQKGLLSVVQVSLLGSILSNTLLVLGGACIAGGLNAKQVKFSMANAQVNTTLLQIAVLGLIVPTTMEAVGQLTVHGTVDLILSRTICVAFLCLYGCYIYFQLVTHRQHFEEEVKQLADDTNKRTKSQASSTSRGSNTTGESSMDTATATHTLSSPGPSSVLKLHLAEEEQQEEEVLLSLRGSLLWLAAATVLVAMLSEILTGVIEEAAEDFGLSETFVGFVILPIIGNAAEHSTAITMAAKGKMDLAFGVALGSSTQIALFVIPTCVLIGWCIDQPLDLYFGVYETTITFLSILIVGQVVADGETNWLEGMMLLFAYLVICFAFAFYNSPS